MTDPLPKLADFVAGLYGALFTYWILATPVVILERAFGTDRVPRA